jgi:hypothetical protein
LAFLRRSYNQLRPKHGVDIFMGPGIDRRRLHIPVVHCLHGMDIFRSRLHEVISK